MTLNPNSSEPIPILAVVVLYRQTPEESKSLSSLLAMLQADEALAKQFSVLVYDNSPQASRVEFQSNCRVDYVHDPKNGGLATAYNYALNLAGARRHDWLLLFDQDTSPTFEFLRELVVCSTSLACKKDVGSMVPKLVVRGEVYSPAAHFVDQLRRQYRRTNHAVSSKIVGIQRGRLGAYNSGATLRVSAIQAIGGFPQDFWLDYLDHAVFHMLTVQGFSMYVMNSRIEHEVSQADVRTVPPWRQRNLLLAQTRFVKLAGTPLDRSVLYRLWLLRYSRTLWRRYPDRMLWKEAFIEAITLKSMKGGKSAGAPTTDG